MEEDVNRPCRKCLLRESGEENALRQVQDCLERMKPDEKADAQLYRKRLSLCCECEHLLGGTCMKCGCYVELRAAFKRNRCPLPKKMGKW